MADPELEELEQSALETENDLLRGALEGPPKGETPAEPAETPPAPEKPAARHRDPATGQFAKASGEPAPAPAPQAAPPPAEQKGDDDPVPSWRLREINEEKRRTAAELDSLRAEHARLQAAWAAQQRQAAPAQRPPPPDPVLDPEGYTRYVHDGLRSEFAAQAAHDRLNMNLEMASIRHGERFEKAFEQLVVEGQRGNQQLVRHLISQPNPGAAIMRWHTQNEVLREVGSDPLEYQKKYRESLLSDPEFLAQAVERSRNAALGGQPNKANTVVKMPVSLAKASGSADIPTTATDGSEEQIFAHAMQPRGRRR